MSRLAALLLFLFGSVAEAQSEASLAAIAASQKLEEASVMLAEAQSGTDRVAALTATVQAYEDGLAALRDGLRKAAIRQAAIEADLNARSDEVARLLGVLQAMGRAPAPLLLLHPTGPTGTARSGMILSDVTPALQDRVEELRATLEEVVLLRQLQAGAADTLRDGLTGAQEARTALTAAMQDRTDLPKRFTEDAVQTALLIASAETLDAFATGLAGTIGGETGVAAPDARNAKGTIGLPVQGRLLHGFNESDAAGIERPGVLIATRARALVTAPTTATLRFRGPLLDYGNVVILEPSADVLFVFAGLAEVYGEAGQIIPEGAPIGLMGGETPPINANLTESGGGGGNRSSETLYLEVREGQSPVNPAHWFALQ